MAPSFLSFVMTCLMSIAVSQESVSVGVNSDGTTTEAKIRPPTQQPTHHGIKIRNSYNEIVDYFWWNPDNEEGLLQGHIRPYGVTATNSYIGHVFYLTKHNDQDELWRFQVTREHNLYILPNFDYPDDQHYQQFLAEERWMKDYKARTGYPWLAHYPRDPPILPMWPASYVGQIHKITSNQSYWRCFPEDSEDEEALSQCRDTQPIELEIKVVSLQPRAFTIQNTLSDEEADLIIKVAGDRLRRSRAGQDGGMVSNTRTSFNTWIGRKHHYFFDTLYRRAADVLQLDESLLWPNKNVEELQVLHYDVGQEYTAHHDFGASGRPNQRMMTLLFYLNNQSSPNAGGETRFPKADEGRGVALHPGKGNSVLFYSMLEDGNADDLSLHAALPVNEGEKWLCNFWVWDPSR
eukprot:220779_1